MGRRSKQAIHTVEKNFRAMTRRQAPLDDNGGLPLPFSVTTDAEAEAAAAARYPFTYRGPNSGENPVQRLHREFKSLSKEERQRLVEEEAADTDLLARTVHLRFLPTGMLQGELAALCAECGEYLRVRICGNSTNAQNWIYGFVEFADRRGAERMLRRSGMELPNGPGKPPLRLKCNAAKQAIVDRVFHDANPPTKTSCIFGSGNFACRTLKEAVDSYYNLKRKEGGVAPTQANAQNSSRSSNTNNTTASLNNELSHSNGTWHPPAPRHHAKPQENSASSLCPPTQTGYHSHSVSNSDEEPAGITPHVHAAATNVNGTVAGDSALAPPLYSQLFQPMSMDQQLGSSSNHDGRSDGATSHEERLNPPFVSQFPVVSSGFQTSFSSLPPPQDSKVERGVALARAAMHGARVFAATGEQFYDAVGALRALLNVLDGHGCHPGRRIGLAGVSHTLEEHGVVLGGGEAEATQRVVQLRLLAHLLLSLLFLQKGNNEESLSSIHSAVLCCNSIPVKRLGRTFSQTASVVPAAPDKPHTVCEAAAMKAKDEETEEDVLPVGFDGSAVEETSCTFNPISQAFDFFGHIDVSGEEEQEPTALGVAMDVPRLDEYEVPLETLQAPDAENHTHDVHLQSYVLNLLLTIGLSTEVAHPVVTRCVYVLAANRSKEVFGATLPALEQTLLEGGVHRLRPVLFPQLEDQNFLETFLQSLGAGEAAPEEVFWSTLPPLHMVRCFPLPRGDASWQVVQPPTL
ncbi:putative RNA-binding protein [Trypanosoma conorhini]|uniref:Putative RNA-binding protein n=1 Tax=Trypanosoma conorhini TaxID=83891 RepID=A0A3R7NPZ1_9TRYP|nr:putative RNA-binding protein [Trypanosoma conorhini]RNF21602.1 putative RNA-binding protein [Trypanosoma conorhini]